MSELQPQQLGEPPTRKKLLAQLKTAKRNLEAAADRVGYIGWVMKELEDMDRATQAGLIHELCRETHECLRQYIEAF